MQAINNLLPEVKLYAENNKFLLKIMQILSNSGGSFICNLQ